MGSATNPISITVGAGGLLAGAGSGSFVDGYRDGNTAAFTGTASITPLSSNPPCILILNGVLLNDCRLIPPPPPPGPPAPSPGLRTFTFPFPRGQTVDPSPPGVTSSDFNLSSDFFFLPYFYTESFTKRPGYMIRTCCRIPVCPDKCEPLCPEKCAPAPEPCAPPPPKKCPPPCPKTCPTERHVNPEPNCCPQKCEPDPEPPCGTPPPEEKCAPSCPKTCPKERHVKPEPNCCPQKCEPTPEPSCPKEDEPEECPMKCDLEEAQEF